MSAEVSWRGRRSKSSNIDESPKRSPPAFAKIPSPKLPMRRSPGSPHNPRGSPGMVGARKTRSASRCCSGSATVEAPAFRPVKRDTLQRAFTPGKVLKGHGFTACEKTRLRHRKVKGNDFYSLRKNACFCIRARPWSCRQHRKIMRASAPASFLKGHGFNA